MLLAVLRALTIAVAVVYVAVLVVPETCARPASGGGGAPRNGSGIGYRLRQTDGDLRTTSSWTSFTSSSRRVDRRGRSLCRIAALPPRQRDAQVFPEQLLRQRAEPPRRSRYEPHSEWLLLRNLIIISAIVNVVRVTFDFVRGDGLEIDEGPARGTTARWPLARCACAGSPPPDPTSRDCC